MSPLWTERLCVALLPDRLIWVILARGLRMSIRAHGSVPVHNPAEGSPWQAVLEALQRELPNIPITRGEVSVVLSNAFMRYLVINSNTALSRPEERLALARHDFQRIHGALVETWEIRLAAGEQNYVAAALDKELLAQLRQCFVTTRLKLHIIQPYAVAAFNHWAKCFNSKTAEGLFLVEPHGYCYAGLCNGQWEFFRCGRWEGEPAETYQRVVQREALRTGSEERSVWLVEQLDASTAKVNVGQKDMKLLPLDETMRDARQAEYLMAILGAM